MGLGAGRGSGCRHCQAPELLWDRTRVATAKVELSSVSGLAVLRVHAGSRTWSVPGILHGVVISVLVLPKGLFIKAQRLVEPSNTLIVFNASRKFLDSFSPVGFSSQFGASSLQ